MSFDEHLWQHLVEEHDAHLAAGPMISARRRHGARVPAGIAVGGVAAAVTAVVVIGGHSDHPAMTIGGARASHAPHAPSGTATNTADILHKARTALDREGSRYVVETDYGTAGGVLTRNWMLIEGKSLRSVQRTLATTLSGRPVYAEETVEKPVDGHMHFHIINVNYWNHTWNQSDGTSPQPIPNHTQHPKTQIPTLASSPRAISNLLRHGVVVRHGYVRARGQRALRLVVKATDGRITLDVNPQTDEPIRFSVREAGTTTSTIELPATAANVALTRDHVPAGFRWSTASTR